MKKLIFVGLIVLLLMSCSNSSVINCNGSNIKYQIIDTTEISQNGFGSMLRYDVIIKIDSSYYSANLNSNGKLSHI